jgi:hypothetical protein
MKFSELPVNDADAWGVWCEVSGGVTGRREAWLKHEGRVASFATQEEAAAKAAHFMRSMNGRPNAGASFRYTARLMI